MMGDRNLKLVEGTLEMLILRTLEAGPMHGWSIGQSIEDVSRAGLQLNQGSLYPALHRLEQGGFIRAKWGVSEKHRRAKFYSLTATGRRKLDHETEQWRRFSGSIELVLQQG